MRPAIRAPDPAAGDAGGRSCRVLIAEDIPDAAEMMRMMLDFMGHEVRVAVDGVHAVAIAKSSSRRSRCSTSACPAWTGTKPAA